MIMNNSDRSKTIESCCTEILKLRKSKDDPRYPVRKSVDDRITDRIIDKYGLSKKFIYELLHLK